MTQPLNIAIIGAGLIGVSCGQALLNRAGDAAIKLHIFERHHAPMRGTSFCNSGMVHPSQALSWDQSANLSKADHILALKAARAVFDLAKLSQRHILDMAKRLKMEDMLVRSHGCVQIFESAAARDNAQDKFLEIGVACEIYCDSIGSFGKPALKFPEDSSGNARDYGQRAAQDLRQRGAVFHYGVDVVDIMHRAQGLRLRVKNQGMSNIEDHNFIEDHDFDHIIIAAGAHSADICRGLGFDVPIIPIKGYAVNFPKPRVKRGQDLEKSLLHFPIPNMPIMDALSRSALTVFKDHIRLSGTWDCADDRPLLAHWSDIAPDFMQNLAPPLTRWSAMRPVSALGRPFICETPLPNLWFNSGHGHMGWTLCAGSGDLMARMILDGEDDQRFNYSFEAGLNHSLK